MTDSSSRSGVSKVQTGVIVVFVVAALLGGVLAVVIFAPFGSGTLDTEDNRYGGFPFINVCVDAVNECGNPSVMCVRLNTSGLHASQDC